MRLQHGSHYLDWSRPIGPEFELRNGLIEKHIEA
jgi:hypothetical protein